MMKIKEVIKLAVYSRFNDFTATKIYHENGINFFTAIFYFKTISNSLIKGCFEIVISDVDYTITCKGFKVFLDNNEIERRSTEFNIYGNEGKNLLLKLIEFTNGLDYDKSLLLTQELKITKEELQELLTKHNLKI